MPWARSQGEPLTGKLSPPPGTRFQAVIGTEENAVYCFLSNAGYGFRAELSQLFTKNRTGRQVLDLSENSRAWKPVKIGSSETDSLALVTLQGRLLIFPANELPQMKKGKGNKLIQIHPNEFDAGEDSIVAAAALPPTSALKIHAGKRILTLKPNDMENYRSNRGRRVDHIEAASEANS